MKKIKTFLYIFILIPVLLTTLSCKDDIFFRISEEIALKDPRIKGSPTNFVMFDKRMYVATGKSLWAYYASTGEWNVGKEGKWSKKSIKGKTLREYNIMQLAVTSSRLYAFCLKDNDASTSRKIIYNERTEDINSGAWSDDITITTGKYDTIHSIYAANDKLYIGAQDSSSNNYAVHVLDANGVFEKTITFPGKNEDDEDNSNSAILKGVETDNGGNVFLCTGNGIFDGDGNALKNSKDESNANYMGIIKLPDDTIVAITRSGTLNSIDTTGITRITNFTDNQTSSALKENRWATVAIGISLENLEDPETSRKLLLIGRRDRGTSVNTGYTYGYFELELDSAGSIIGKRFNEPGAPEKGSYSSVGPSAASSYASSIGILPIKDIFQAPNGIIFASTHQSGVWSYKYRKEEKMDMWNSEE